MSSNINPFVVNQSNHFNYIPETGLHFTCLTSTIFNSSSFNPLFWPFELPFMWELKHLVTRCLISFQDVHRREFHDWPIEPPQPRDVTPAPPEQSAPWHPVLEPEPSPKSSWTVINVLGTVAAVVVADEPRGPPCIVPASWMIAGAPGAELSTDLNPPPATPGPLPYSKMVVIVLWFGIGLNSNHF